MKSNRTAPAADVSHKTLKPHTRKRRPRTPPRLRKPGRREQVAAREQRAMELRRSGATLERIAEVLGVSAMQVHRDVRKALAAIVARRDSDTEALVQMELERLDAVTLAMTSAAKGGNARAAAVLVRASESRRRLLGLDAAVRMELTGAYGGPVAVAAVKGDDLRLTDEEVHRRLRLARKLLEPGLPVAETPSEPPELTPTQAYAAELARRNGGEQ